jgi:hypothetical protein
MEGNTPLLVMVGDRQRVGARPGAAFRIRYRSLLASDQANVGAAVTQGQH